MKYRNNLILLLEQKHMTQKELGKRTNMSEAVISRYVSSLRVPNVLRAMEIAKVLGTTVDKIWIRE